MVDYVSRQSVLEICNEKHWNGTDDYYPITADEIEKRVRQLPPVKPEPSMPLSFIRKHIEWLKSFDNSFADMTAMSIRVMLKHWREQNKENR